MFETYLLMDDIKYLKKWSFHKSYWPAQSQPFNL